MNQIKCQEIKGMCDIIKEQAEYTRNYCGDRNLKNLNYAKDRLVMLIGELESCDNMAIEATFGGN